MMALKPVLSTVVSVGLDYLRWTQLVPMVTAWTFLALLTGAMVLVSFQDESFALIDRGLTWWDPAWAATESETNPATDAADEPASETLHFTEADFMPQVLTAWGIVALVGHGLSVLRSALFAPRERRPLRRQLAWAGAAGIPFAVALLLCYRFGQAPYQGPAIFWFALFAGAPLAAWVVSAYSLSVNEVLLRCKDSVHGNLTD